MSSKTGHSFEKNLDIGFGCFSARDVRRFSLENHLKTPGGAPGSREAREAGVCTPQGSRPV